MALMANKIAASIDKMVPFPREYYVQKERMIKINTFIEIKIILNDASFKMIDPQERKVDSKITEKNAAKWIQDNIVGCITKRDLDDERIRENNVLDMMENTNFLGHTESI